VTVEYDGNMDGLFLYRRRSKKKKQWVLFTRGLLDKLLSFVVFGKSTYTAATRHLAADVPCFRLRRQDVVKIGTVAARTFSIPPETSRCPICVPNPKFIVIDAQALVCTDPDDVTPFRPGEDCPVLPIDASKLCVIDTSALRAAIEKLLGGSKELTTAQVEHLRAWHDGSRSRAQPHKMAAAAALFFLFFPLGSPARGASATGTTTSRKEKAVVGPNKEAGNKPDEAAANRGDLDGSARVGRGAGLEASLRRDEEGNLVLGGPGKPVASVAETWRDRSGICAPNVSKYSRDGDCVWLALLPILKELLAETATSMIQGHDERAICLLADALRLRKKGLWRKVTKAADGVGFVASFLGNLADELDADKGFRVATGVLLRQAADVEGWVDKEFAIQAARDKIIDKGWTNSEYCRLWGHTPMPAEYAKWRKRQARYNIANIDDPHVSYECFASLPRVRPAIKDSVAEQRRSKYHGKKRHAADIEGDDDTCNKAFSVTTGLTQGVFNVVCPHVVTLGFRCLFRAESVGEALSIVLKRFPRLPEVIFYDVACKLDKNALRRVRPIMRAHGDRCILDRPHSITHGCSPVYMPHQSLGSTAGVATQAAEVSHSVSVGNRTSLAYMVPTTYMSHRMLQVAHINLRKLAKLDADNPTGENNHQRIESFFHDRVVKHCERGRNCLCDKHKASSSRRDAALMVHTATRSTSTGARSLLAVGRRIQGSSNGAEAAADGPVPKVALPPAADQVGAPPAAPQVQVSSLSAAQPVRSSWAGSSSSGEEDMPLGEDAFDLGGVEAFALGASVATDVPDPPALVDAVPKAMKLFGGGLSCQPLSKEQMLFLFSLTANRAGETHVSPSNKGNISLTVADLHRLAGERWLNEELMNSYGALINSRDKELRSLGGAQHRRTVVMNTHFYDRLNHVRFGYDYDGVSRWGVKAGVDLQDIYLLLVPVNLMRSHLVLVAMDFEERCLVYFDSFLSGDTAGTMEVVRRWVVDEAAHHLGEDAAAAFDFASWMTREEKHVPAQSDSCSCGVFALMSANCLSLRAPMSYTQADIPVVRQRLCIDLVLDRIEWTLDDAIAAGRS